ncbi:MAG TPA: hypothetical protein VK590_09535, partial [Saprospiraceae bacterium]|nr:hypothetical protein [Saprospiraceae bacterium]
IDISNNTSNDIDEYKGIEFDYVITVCDNAKEKCPIFHSREVIIHKNFPDPSKEQGSEQFIINKFKEVRDSIKSFCKSFVKNNL